MRRFTLLACVVGPAVACGLDRTGVIEPAPPLPERDAGAPDVVDAAPADVVVEAEPPDIGNWYQANEEDCGPFCEGLGKKNVASPEGAKCTSGENIPQSALDAKIQYDVCWPDCTAHVGKNPKSYGRDCYADGQNRDGDKSDETRGCFCK